MSVIYNDNSLGGWRFACPIVDDVPTPIKTIVSVEEELEDIEDSRPEYSYEEDMIKRLNKKYNAYKR